MKSPCVKVCVMDSERGVCKGCWRTLEEIGRWGSMTDAEREQILTTLPQREKSALDVPKVSVPPLP